MTQQVLVKNEIKVERVVDFLLLHRRWFDTPALKLLLSLVPDIESFWGCSPFEIMLLIVIACASNNLHVLQAACFFFSILQILVMDAFLGYRFLNSVELLAETRCSCTGFSSLAPISSTPLLYVKSFQR